MSYSDNVLTVQPAHLLAYWRLNEPGGTMVDSSGNGYDGLATTNTKGGIVGIGDDSKALWFDGSPNGYVNVYSAGLSAAFNGDAGTVIIWFRIDDTATWSDGTNRFLFDFWGTPYLDLQYVSALKSSTNNTLAFGYRAGAATKNISIEVTPDTLPHCAVVTWDAAADEFKAFLDGEQVGSTLTGLGVWSATGLYIFQSLIGNYDMGEGNQTWDGILGHCALWDVALTPDEIAYLAWLPSITDRDAADLIARVPKAFFNVEDWMRIDQHTLYCQEQILALLGVDVTLNTLTVPDITTIPTAAEINELIENIDRLRLAVSFPAALGLVALDYDYEAGTGAVAPDYEDVNAWENDLKLLKEGLEQAAGYFIPCGVGTSGQSHLWQARFRGS